MIGKEKYFKVLGIHPTEDQNIIKKAYRKQALKFHPDRNKSPDAHIRFIKITEAYEVLSGQRKIHISSGTTYRTKTKEEILAEKVAQAKERWRRQQAEEERKDREYFKEIASGWKWGLFKVFALYTTLFATLFICDYYLDGQSVSFPGGDHQITLNVYSRTVCIEGEYFKVTDRDFWFEAGGSMPIRGEYSYLFNDLKAINILTDPLPAYNPYSHSDQRMYPYQHFENKALYESFSYNSIYGAFPLLHLMFFVPLILVIFKRPNLRFSIWRLVSIWIIFPTIVFFSLNNDRIFKLLDLILEG